MARDAFTIDVEADVEEAKRFLTRTQRKVVPKAAARALNRTLTNVRTVSRRKVAKGMGQKQKAIKGQFKMIKASRNRLIGLLRTTGNPIPLIEFKSPKQFKKGVKVTFAGERQLMENAFIATMPSGRTGIFRRQTKKRLPIRELFGPSVPAWFATREVNKAMEDTANENWPQNFARDLDFFLSRQR